jgi:hypothetical protein
MEIELDIGLKRDRLKIPKKWIGGSIKGGEKKKKEKKSWNQDQRFLFKSRAKT